MSQIFDPAANNVIFPKYLKSLFNYLYVVSCTLPCPVLVENFNALAGSQISLEISLNYKISDSYDF